MVVGSRDTKDVDSAATVAEADAIIAVVHSSKLDLTVPILR